jgi:lipoate-protein ligase A
MKEWSLIVESVPLRGSLNMAIDEYLFRSLGQTPQTYVRFYQWEKPTASLGYSQDAEKAVNLDFCEKNGIDVVRRITGGKLVLHWREITYSFASSDRQAFGATLAESYRLISNAIIQGLEKMGLKARRAGPPPSSYKKGNMPCFSYPARDEIEIDGMKIVGSAQKRVGTRFLQHGSIPLHADEDLLKHVTLLQEADSQIRMTSLSEALGRPVTFEWAEERLAAGIAEFFGISFKPKLFQPDENAVIFKIQKEKYENEEWIWGKHRSWHIDFFSFE